MRVRLKGIHSSRKRLADGTVKTYFYAWKNGPPLPGEPGTPAFMAAYNAAVSAKVGLSSGTLISVLTKYQQSSAWSDLADRTRKDYAKHIAIIGRKFGDFPLSGLEDRRTRGILLAWRDALALASKRQADYTFSVFALVPAWALDRGLVTKNPLERRGRTYKGSRVDFIWSDEQVQSFLANAPKQLHLPMLLARWTGQRQGDLLRLPWSAYDGKVIRLRQSKTDVSVVIPVAKPLKAALDEAKRCRTGTIILTNTEGHPWNADVFGAAWRKACKAAGIEGLTFHDLRGTAATRMAIAGATEPEIASVTGHTLRDIRRVLDAHYLHRHPELAESAIRKLERGGTGTKPSN
jgi:integrase